MNVVDIDPDEVHVVLKVSMGSFVLICFYCCCFLNLLNLHVSFSKDFVTQLAEATKGLVQLARSYPQVFDRDTP